MEEKVEGRMHPKAKLLLVATHCKQRKNCPMRRLARCPHILKKIHGFVVFDDILIEFRRSLNRLQIGATAWKAGELRRENEFLRVPKSDPPIKYWNPYIC